MTIDWERSEIVRVFVGNYRTYFSIKVCVKLFGADAPYSLLGRKIA